MHGQNQLQSITTPKVGVLVQELSLIDGLPLSEEIVFPFLNEKLDFSGEMEAHKVVHHGLDEILAYIGTVSSGSSTFDAAHLKGLMTQLRDPLVRSLQPKT